MLVCEDCGMTSSGDATHWIALLVADENRIAAYCPHCAEANFRYFSRKLPRRRRLED
jgi:hypothetical protein